MATTRKAEGQGGAKVATKPPDDAKILTVQEVAFELRRSVDTVYRLIAGGELEFTRIGSRRFVSRDSLSRFLEGNTARAVPKAAGQKVDASVGLLESGMWNGKDY